MALSQQPGAAEAPRDSLLGRRELLSRLGLGGLLLALGGGAALALRSLWPRSRRISRQELIAGPIETFVTGTVDDRMLREHRIWIVRTDEGFLAYSARCTHLGCQLRYAEHAGQYRCMCHGSVFSAQGQVLRGPATRPMERVQVAVRDGVVQVNPAIHYRQERGEWQQPGAFAPWPSGRKGT